MLQCFFCCCCCFGFRLVVVGWLLSVGVGVVVGVVGVVGVGVVGVVGVVRITQRKNWDWQACPC